MTKLKKLTLAVIAMLILWVGGFVLFSLSALINIPQGEEETTDAIVVLTGGKNRVEEGLTLFANGRGTHLFISGVFKDVKKREILSQWKGDTALPPCCVTLGYKATSTQQNALETAEWIAAQDYSSIRLVTGDYHMGRSLMEMRHALPDIDIYAHPVPQPDLPRLSLRYWKLLFSEYHKSLYRRVQLLFTPRPKFETPEG